MSPLEQFLRIIQASTYLDTGNMTEEGLETFRRQIFTALPFLPTIIAKGQWHDWANGAPSKAISALVAVAPEPEEEAGEYGDYRESEACYITGLLSGLALAHALAGSTVGGEK